MSGRKFWSWVVGRQLLKNSFPYLVAKSQAVKKKSNFGNVKMYTATAVIHKHSLSAPAPYFYNLIKLLPALTDSVTAFNRESENEEFCIDWRGRRTVRN